MASPESTTTTLSEKPSAASIKSFGKVAALLTQPNKEDWLTRADALLADLDGQSLEVQRILVSLALGKAFQSGMTYQAGRNRK
jgi:hypothetical protein